MVFDFYKTKNQLNDKKLGQSLTLLCSFSRHISEIRFKVISNYVNVNFFKGLHWLRQKDLQDD